MQGTAHRRDFLRAGLALAGLAVLPGCGVAPPGAHPMAKLPRLGYLHPGAASSPVLRGITGAFVDGLRELGYAEGQNLAIEWRWAEGREERLPELAVELVRLPVDLIVAVGSAINAARSASATMPIVFPAHSDPVGSGLVASLARPGGNLTGLSAFNAAIGGKRLELLREVAPGLSRVGVLWYAPQPTAAAAELRALEAAAQVLNVRLQALSVGTPEDLQATFAAMAAGRVEGLLTIASPVLTEWRERVAELAAAGRLPALYPNRELVEAGGLLCYGVNVPDLFRRAASYVDKILRGTNPADLPVEQPARFDFVVNLRTAETLRLTIPPSVLQQATELIQ